MNHKVQVGKLIIGLAEYYDKQLTPNQVDMYVEDLLDLSVVQLGEAIKQYRQNPKNVFFPLPAQLKTLIFVPGPSTEEQAVEIASRIAGAVARIGPYQHSRAKEYIGHIGWAIVKTLGGWEQVCNFETGELGIHKAQWRELAKSFIAKEKRGDEIMPNYAALDSKLKQLQITGPQEEQLPEKDRSEVLKKILPELQKIRESTIDTKPREPISTVEKRKQVQWLNETDGKISFEEWSKKAI